MPQDPFFDYIKNETSISKELYKNSPAHKSYNRFPKILLPKAGKIEANLSDLITLRESVREYSHEAISLQQLSDFIYWSAGLSGKVTGGIKKRSYPSGGAKYPIEIYLTVNNITELERGVYHYDAYSHQLINLPIVDLNKILGEITKLEDFAKKSSVLILFSFLKSRSFGKYGTLAYKLAFMEAGTICQNMYLAAPALGLGCCALGGKIPSTLLNLSDDENIIGMMAIGSHTPTTNIQS